MTINEIERIEHEEAMRVFDGTEYDWADMLDWQSLKDLKRELRRKDAEEVREAFAEYFSTMLEELRWEEGYEG